MTTIGGWSEWPPEVRIGLVAGLVAMVWSVLVLDPLGAATIDPDASSSVLYFQRVVSGQRLEAFVPTTPKPLLTLVFGLTWALTDDWRTLVWETVVASGVAVGATAALVARLANRGTAIGAVSGAAFVGSALLVSSDLMLEVSRANSLVWALAFWALAGLAVTARPARPVLAGVALLLAGLCRFETLALLALAVAAVLVWRHRPLPRHAGLGVALAAGSIPLVLLHDWLLGGDPLYFLSVPGRYTTIFNPGLAPIDPLAYSGTFASKFASEWPLLLLAAVGAWALMRARNWLVLAGIAAIVVGQAGLLFVLAARATYISNRYYEPIDLALIVAAAIGVGAAVALLAGARPTPTPLAPLGAGAALVLGIAVSWPALPFDRRASTELSDVRTASEHVAVVRDELARLLRPTLINRDFERATQLIVPSRDVSRVSVETGASLDRVPNSYAMLLNGGPGALRSGQVLFHDGAADRPVALYKDFEIDDQGALAGNILVRLDPRQPGIWLLSVR